MWEDSLIVWTKVGRENIPTSYNMGLDNFARPLLKKIWKKFAGKIHWQFEQR